MSWSSVDLCGKYTGQTQDRPKHFIFFHISYYTPCFLVLSVPTIPICEGIFLNSCIFCTRYIHKKIQMEKSGLRSPSVTRFLIFDIFTSKSYILYFTQWYFLFPRKHMKIVLEVIKYWQKDCFHHIMPFFNACYGLEDSQYSIDIW